MKIAIISDIHDNLVNLEKCLNWCNDKNIEHLICCGDVTNSETLKFLADKFKGSIYLVKGNMEIFDENEVKRYSNIKYFGKIGRFKIGKSLIGACHEPYLMEKVLEKGSCDIVFYGHTHKPWSSCAKALDDREVTTVNPGTLGGVFTKATFAVWDNEDKKLELKILELL